MLNQPVLSSAFQTKFLLIIFFLSLILASFSLGFLSAYVVKPSEPERLNTLSPPPNNLPPKLLELLESPMFSTWRGTVEGRVIEKTPTTLTLEKDGGKIMLYVDRGTVFRINPLDSEPIILSYEEITIGTKLIGAVNFEKDDKGNLLTIAGRLMSVFK